MSAGACPRYPCSSLKPADAVEEIVGVAIGQRRDPEADVAEHFDMDAAEPEGDERAEQRIVGDADHRFDAAGDHRLNHHAFAVGRDRAAVPAASA